MIPAYGRVGQILRHRTTPAVAARTKAMSAPAQAGAKGAHDGVRDPRHWPYTLFQVEEEYQSLMLVPDCVMNPY